MIPAVVQKVPVDVLIDSGSDISLISESVLKHFEMNRKPCYRVMRGIGSQVVQSTSLVETVVELPEVSLAADLYVVPAECISAPILIGTDVLNRTGLTYIRTGGKQRLIRSDVSQVEHVSALEVRDVKTPLFGEE